MEKKGGPQRSEERRAEERRGRERGRNGEGMDSNDGSGAAL